MLFSFCISYEKCTGSMPEKTTTAKCQCNAIYDISNILLSVYTQYAQEKQRINP